MSASILSSLAKLVHGTRNRYLLAWDVAMIALGALVSFDVRFDTLYPHSFQDDLLTYICLAVGVRIAVLWAAGVYRVYWTYGTADDVVRLVLGLTLSTAALAVLVVAGLAVGAMRSFPRSVLVIDYLAAVCLLGCARFALLAFGRHHATGPRRKADRDQPVLIAGAGAAGAMIAREIDNNPGSGLTVVGFCDDDPAKQGSRVHGLPVLGTSSDLRWLVPKYEVPQVIIAMPSASGHALRQIRECCRKAGASVRTMPGLYDIISGRVGLQQIRDVQIEDLLRRAPVETDVMAVHGQLVGKRVAITGAGGSIGRELCRQIAGHAPGQLILIGHGENSIFEIEQELKRKFPQLSTLAVIADIRNRRHIESIFARSRVQVVFHAAAHKHVPLMEANVVEAVTNNVLGTRNVVRAAEVCGAERLVMISTDKAVQPQSVMGCTKRLAEWVVQAAAKRTGRPFVAVRFGNVLNSRGSVIPLFREQIRTGGPVSVTHQDMTRYFMTIPEAVQLVLQSGAIGKGGEVFVLDMGEPVKIVDLARDMIELSGLKPYEDIDIVFTGIRPGEKLHETLFYPDESLSYTPHPKILVTRNGCGAAVDGLDETLGRLEQLAADCREVEVRDTLETIMASCRDPGLQTGGEENASEHHQIIPGDAGHFTLRMPQAQRTVA